MTDALAFRNEYRSQQWAAIIQECNESGLTNKEFCRQRGISEKSYYYWLHKFRSQMLESVRPKLVEIETASLIDDALHIRYKGAELHLPAGVNLNAVAEVLRSIQSL